MTHYAVIVAGNDPAAILAPHDENLEVPPYVERTRAELIAEGRMEAERWTRIVAEFDRDPHKAGRRYGSGYPGLVRRLHKSWQETTTDQQVWEKMTEDLDTDEHGNALSTLNPNPKWDWWEIGGRFDGGLVTLDGIKCNQTTRGNLDIDRTRITFAIVTDTEWTSRPHPGDHAHGAAWEQQWRDTVRAFPPDTPLTLIDAHI